MKLILSEITEAIEHLDHYTGKPVPAWMRKMEPHAAASLIKLDRETGGLSYTDLWRSAEVSLHARQTKRGVQPPGYSAHNYGVAVDLDLDGTMKKRGWTYDKLIEVMKSYGWYCHRQDGKGGRSESWHFNYLGPDAAKYMKYSVSTQSITWDKPVESRITELYGSQFLLSDSEVQAVLKKLGLYKGDVDGKFGPISRTALMVFQKGWDLQATGMTDPRTSRTLAFIGAEITLVPPAVI
jgi:hypothetical protein